MTTATLPPFAEVLPAYGRDYKTMKEVQDDWRAGKDFILAATSKYCSIRDQAPGTQILLRYKALRNIASFKKPKSA